MPKPGACTLQEIFQQPALWPTTVERALAGRRKFHLDGRRLLFTGAGTSAYAADAIAAAGFDCRAVPTTDLLVDAERHLAGMDAVISLARSGDSPESAAVVERVRALAPGIPQFAITCNPQSRLTRAGLDGIIFLDPRSNDRSLVMTSAFSNLALGGLCLLRDMDGVVTDVSRRAEKLLPAIDKACAEAAAKVRDRMVILASSPLHGWAQEARLKALEMTAGAFPVMAETFLGLRHGPMSFLRPDTFILCLLSSGKARRRYELDLVGELRAKKIGILMGIADPAAADGLFDMVIPALAPDLADELRTPFEIAVPQLLGYHLSLMKGLDPDNPSPGGVINRVVQGVTIHKIPEGTP